jgi:hypothetical protein
VLVGPSAHRGTGGGVASNGPEIDEALYDGAADVFVELKGEKHRNLVDRILFTSEAGNVEAC